MSNSPQFRHILIIEDKKGRRVVTLEDNTYSIGRDPKNSIVLYDNQVSRYHATLLRINDYKNNSSLYRIMDGDLQGKRSTNGLIINGRTCVSHELNHGDFVIFAGKVKASYQIILNNKDLDLLKDSQKTQQAAISKATVTDESKQTVIFSDSELKKSQEVVISKSTVKDESKQTVIFNDSELNKVNQDELTRLASFPEFSPNPIIEINWEGEVTYLNPAASIKFKDIEQAKKQHPIIADILDNHQNRQGNLFVREVKIANEIFEQYVHYLSETQLIRSYIFDLTKRKQIETALRESEERYKAIVSHSGEGIFCVEAISKKIIEANSAYCRLVNYTPEEILQLTLDDLVAINDDKIEKDLPRLLTEKIDLKGESSHSKKDGSLIKVEVSISLISHVEKDIIVFIVRDATLGKQSEEEFQYQAFHDPLTGLPNRTLFYEHLSTAIANATRYQYLMAILIFDLDNFKNINVNLGHNVGDEILRTFAQKLRNYLRSGDIVARWGGDEFIVLLPRIINIRDINIVAARLSKSLQESVKINNQSVECKTSIGIGIYPDDGEDAQSIVKKATTALEKIKKEGGGNYSIAGLKTNNNSLLLSTSENPLQQAIEREELLLYYQPIVNIKSGKIISMEALLRWQHPELGLLLPKDIIPLALEKQLIVPLGEWVLYNACQQNKRWQEAGLSPVPIAVNLSNREFQKENLLLKIEEILDKTGLEPHWLELEITENTIGNNTEIMRQNLEMLFHKGVRFCLDDFGSGPSSVNYFKQFRFQKIKISQSIIGELKEEPQELGIISAIIALGNGFNIKVIAKGVETKQQLEILRRLHCQEVQGNIFSEPVGVEEANNLLSLGNFSLVV